MLQFQFEFFITKVNRCSCCSGAVFWGYTVGYHFYTSWERVEKPRKTGIPGIPGIRIPWKLWKTTETNDHDSKLLDSKFFLFKIIASIVTMVLNMIINIYILKHKHDTTLAREGGLYYSIGFMDVPLKRIAGRFFSERSDMEPFCCGEPMTELRTSAPPLVPTLRSDDSVY